MSTILPSSSRIAVILLLFSLVACREKEQAQTEARNTETYCLDSTFRDRIDLINPAYEKVAEAIHLTGSVEANPDRVVTFVSLVSGIVTGVNFSIGDRVQKGQVLAELHSTELSALQSEQTSLKSRITVSEKRVQSAEAMHRDGISSERELMEAKSELDILKSELARTSADLELYSASVSKGVFQIKAPASGVVTFKSITPGSPISSDSGPLFTISDLSQIWILANVHATSVKNIEQGMEVGITTLSYPDESFKGKISNISSVMDQEAKVLKARIELPNQDLKLKPGMLVDINAFKPTDRTALSLPTSSLVFDDNQNFVVIYKGDCEVTIRRVDALSRNHQTTYLSGGLDSTDTVISKNQLLIFEQLKNFQN
jgi:cobalt-zinc-cadmium efflux system membrane fusion protein